MLIDSHCHPYMTDFDAVRSEMLERARWAGVSAVIATEYHLESSRQAVAFRWHVEVDVAARVTDRECAAGLPPAGGAA